MCGSSASRFASADLLRRETSPRDLAQARRFAWACGYTATRHQRDVGVGYLAMNGPQRD